MNIRWAYFCALSANVFEPKMTKLLSLKKYVLRNKNRQQFKILIPAKTMS